MGIVENLPEFINGNDSQSDAPPLNSWWERIDDPVLTIYVDELLAGNLDLKEAGERLVQARERVRVQRGEQLPEINLNSSYDRSMNPVGGERVYSTAIGLELNTSWEIDLWGKLQRSQESAEANYFATEFDRIGLTHALVAELVNRRVAVAVNRQLLDLAWKNQENRKAILQFTKRRHELGVRGTNLSDVLLAEENYTSVLAETAQFQRLLVEEAYRLDVLLGKPPGTTDPESSAIPLMVPPHDLPVALPAMLLDRRPDLRATEYRLQAATADIGVAIGDLYPSVNLGASIGVVGDDLDNFLSADQLAGSIFGTLMNRLFSGGALRANIRIQESEARELTAQYSKQILEAVREVETALFAEQELNKEIANVERSVEALKRAEKILADRYVRGTGTFRELLDTQQRRYSTEQLLLQKQQEKWRTRVSLYLALGGDWFESPVHISSVHQ